ncbi:MAG TPA: hypothetical protein VMS38_21390 [Pseudorhodoferax sp.]|nr:hypothetical protein [Pseudorhodoferax sp.]
MSWAGVAQIVAALMAMGGVCLHLMGATYNAAYYERWGVDVAFFPLPTDATLVLGYQALLNGLAEGALALYVEYRTWLVAYGGFLALALGMGLWIGLRQLRGEAVWSPSTRWRRAAQLGTPLLAAFAIPSLVVPYAGLLAVFALALPMSTAEKYAQQQVDSRLAAYQKGCSHSATPPCTTASRIGEAKVTGFLVGASSSHIAVYDPAEHKVVTLERAGLVLSVDLSSRSR